MENNFNLEILKVMYRAADELISSGSIILPAAIKAGEIVSRQKKGLLPFVWGESFPASGARDGYFVEIAKARMDHDDDKKIICRECRYIGEKIVLHFFVGTFHCSLIAESLFRIIRRFEQLAGVTAGNAKVFAPKQTEHVNIIFKAVITSAIRALVPFCSKDNLRPVLTGICFDPIYGAAVATDGHKLQVCPADMIVSDMNNRIVVPAAVIRVSKKDDILTVDDKGSVYVNDKKVSSIINDAPYVSWISAFTPYASCNIANCWQLGKEWNTIKKMVKSVSKAAPEDSHVVAVYLDGKKFKVVAKDIDYDLHREESAILNIQDNGKSAVFGVTYDYLLMHKGVERLYIGADSQPLVLSMKKGVIGMIMPYLLNDDEMAGFDVKLEEKRNNMNNIDLLRYYGFIPGDVQTFSAYISKSTPAKADEPETANDEMSAPANDEMSAPANDEMSAPANVEMSAPANVEMSAPANVEMSDSANVEMSAPASVEESVSESVEMPVTASVEESVSESVEMPVTASVEESVSESVEMPVTASVEESVSESVEMPVTASVEESVSESVEMPVTASVEESVSESVEMPITASVEDPSMDKVIYKIFAIAACYIAVLILAVTAFDGNDKASAKSGRVPSYKAIERVITPARYKVSRTPNKPAQTRLFAANTKTFSGSGNTIATDTVTTDTITTDTMTTDTVTTDTITTDTMTTDTVTTDTITTDTMTTAPFIPASPESSINDDSKEGSTPAALALIPVVLPIIGSQKNDRKADKNKPNINPSELSDTKQKNMEKVSYGFSEALNLADDFRDALADLQADPTGSQIVVETNIKDNNNRGSWYDGCIYFLIQKCNYKYDDYKETPYYTLSLSYVEADESVIKPLLEYEDKYSLDDLKNIVREIIDNIQITRIYPDSL